MTWAEVMNRVEVPEERCHPVWPVVAIAVGLALILDMIVFLAILVCISSP